MQTYLKKNLLATLTLLWLLAFCRSQTCPSYEAGDEGTVGLRRDPDNNEVYIDTVDSAPCAGTVYGWRFCSHPISDPGASVQMSMYRSEGDNRYQLVSGSLYQLTLQENISSYTCLDRLLEESEYFSVEEGDMVAACWSEENRVEIFNRYLGQIRSGGNCGQNMIDGTNRVGFRQISLSAYINVNECELGESSCHENASCSDVVGGENSYKCTCKTGFTGDGLSCVVDDTGMGGGTGGTVSPSSSNSSSSGDGVSGGVVAAIVIVLILLLGAVSATVAVLVGILLHRRKKLQTQKLTSVVTTPVGEIITGKNEAYNPLTINTSSDTTSEEPVSITTACNEAYNVLPYFGRGETGAITTQSNEAYNLVSHIATAVDITESGVEQSGATRDIITGRNEAYNLLTINTSSDTTSEEPASITTACNEAYNVLPYSGRGETGAITTHSNEAYNLVSHTGMSAEPYYSITRNEAYHMH